MSSLAGHPTVLIIDDNIALAENLRELLEEEGARVHTASTGKEALEMMASLRPQLIVTDMRMPGMSGVDVLLTVRRRWPQIPVILITAYSQDVLLEEARAGGALAVLSKPVDLHHLCALVGRTVDHDTDILVVDDDPNVRSSLMEALQEIDGVVPHAAAGVAEAQRLASVIDFSAAIVDIRLRDGDGVELGDWLRRETGGSMRVVHITGYLPEVREVLAAATPPVAVLEKPYSTSHLLEVVRDAL